MGSADEVRALSERAAALHAQGKYADAIECLHTLERHLPGNPALLTNLGVVLRDFGDLQRAEQYLRLASAADPDNATIHFHLAQTLLRAGRLQEGFREYEWRWQVPQFAEQRREFPQPLWQGEPLEGRRVLVYGEQGAGDTIQFARYIPMLQQAGGEVTFEVLPHLERLLNWMDGGCRIVNLLSNGGQHDLQCPLMSLPDRFGTTLDSIPPPARFSIPSDMKAKWSDRLRSECRRAGIVWSGNPKQYSNSARSVPGQLLAPLTRTAGIQCWSLQLGTAAAEAPDGIVSLAAELTDFAETAGAISALDIVITVDTAVAHLAGSLGKPVWLLASYAADWRWLLDREDTPWYPTMRIFRQQRPGEWSPVIERVVAELAALRV